MKEVYVVMEHYDNGRCYEESFTVDNILIIASSLEKAKWDLCVNGMSSKSVRAISNTIRLHKANDVSDILIARLKPIDYNKLEAEAKVRYPERKLRESLVMILEDILEENGIERVYYGGSVTNYITLVA